MIEVPVEYNVVRGENVHYLAKNVEAAIQDGFEPTGGVCSQENGNGPIFMQAVVRYEFISGVEAGRRADMRLHGGKVIER